MTPKKALEIITNVVGDGVMDASEELEYLEKIVALTPHKFPEAENVHDNIAALAFHLGLACSFIEEAMQGELDEAAAKAFLIEMGFWKQ